MKYPLRTSFITLSLLVSAALPSLAFAHESATSTLRDAVAPVGMVGSSAGELASFVLSVVALVVAGIALSRTGRRVF